MAVIVYKAYLHYFLFSDLVVLIGTVEFQWGFELSRDGNRTTQN